MSLAKYYALACDRCGRLYDVNRLQTSSAKARAQARKAGWLRYSGSDYPRPDGRDFCSTRCAERAGFAVTSPGKLGLPQ